MVQQVAASPLLRQVLRFALVGGLATAVHYLILIALVEGAHAKPLIASTIGYCVGVLVSYVLNRRFTFASQSPVASSLAKYMLLYAVGLGLNGALLATIMSLGAPYLMAQVGATAIVLIWNFIGARYVVFR